jgi:hypothetical protein
VTFEESPAALRAPPEFVMRVLQKFVGIEGAQQATVLSAQAFTSLTFISSLRMPGRPRPRSPGSA